MRFPNGLKITFTEALNNFFVMMGILLIAVLLMVIFGGCLSMPPMTGEMKEYDPKKAKKDSIDVVCNGKLAGSFSMKQYEALIKASDQYGKLLEAEGKDRLKIELKDNPWEIKAVKDTFETSMKLVWYSEEGKAIKSVEMRIRLNKTDGSWVPSRISEQYTQVSRVMFPITTITTVVLIILLVILL